MRENHDEKRLDDLRDRLYDRGGAPKKQKRFELTDEQKSVPTSWQDQSRDTTKSSDINKAPVSRPVQPPRSAEVVPEPEPEVAKAPESAPSFEAITSEAPTNQAPMPRTNRRKSIRIKMLLAGIFFFVIAVGVSSVFILFGSNAISGDNIEISLNGPFTIGGGEILRLQVGVTNQNAVPIESATLIIEYPPGTQSAGEDDRELFVERLPLDVIESGETVNIPVQAKVFGEENSEFDVNASVEYRVRGSNATFFKEADALLFKISSSPVVLTVDADNNLSSGQETNITLTVSSNSPEPLNDILVRAEYPANFDFAGSEPRPVSGQNVWLIESLEPESETSIDIRGTMIGNFTDTNAMHFEVGVPNERDRYTLASVFSTASTEFEIEEPFIEVGVLVNNVLNSTAVIPPNSSSNVVLQLKNTLQNTIYDSVVKIVLSGNAIADTKVLVGDGFYDSNTRTITWDVSSAPELAQIVPGGIVQFTFSVNPRADVLRTPQINLEAEVFSSRLSEPTAQEEIVGTVESILKVSTGIGLTTKTRYNDAGFNDSGPVPPIVGQTTSYTLEWVVANGSNDISNAVMTAILPSYINWEDQTAGVGSFDFNPTSRVVTWDVGSMPARTQAKGTFQVSFRPSASQIGQIPTLIGQQRFRADDDFTGTVVRADQLALTTLLREEDGYPEDAGTVLANN